MPIVEIWLILQVAELLGGGAQGAGLTILLLVGSSLLGAYLLRTQGGSVWKQFRSAMNEGRPPTNEVVNGGFVILGGTLLIVPGFLTDTIGLLMLLPPTRKIFSGRALAFVSRRVKFTTTTGAADTGVRDFARSSQPHRAPTPPQVAKAPDFDFETHPRRE